MPSETSPSPSWKQTLLSANSWRSAFPIVQWLPVYNRQWLFSDILCGLTVGMVVIPQAMAYAKIAGLPPQYGLYSSVTGAFLYPFLGTSKDISIGTTAINSLLVGNIIADIVSTPQFQTGVWTFPHVVASLTLCSGLICFLVGCLRLGILFDFISQPLLAGFMAGSALTIAVNQLGKIFGIPSSDIDTTKPTYMIFGQTLMNIPHVHLDAVLGISALIFLYSVRFLALRWSKRYPRYACILFYINISRNIILVTVPTLLSYLVLHFHGTSPFFTLGMIPAGFQNTAVPQWDASLLTMVMTKMIGIVVLQIMEHCSIATSLGKLSDYKINVNQEIMATGIANILGAFFCAYPMTGAFARSAVTAKSGAQTPLCHLFAGIIVVVTLYFFTPALQYIPNAAIGAIVMHAVTDLITGPRVWIKFWNTHPSEFLVFASAYITSLVTRMDISVYVPLALSLVFQLHRVARPSLALLGHAATHPHADYTDEHPNQNHHVMPLDPGIVYIQPCSDLVFQNVRYLFSQCMDLVKTQTRCGAPNGPSRPWSDPAPTSDALAKPLASSIVLDLSHVFIMDYSAMAGLAELSTMIDRYAAKPVPWFLVLSRATDVRHPLLYAGFGTQRRKHTSNPFPFHSDLQKNHRLWSLLPCLPRPKPSGLVTDTPCHTQSRCCNDDRTHTHQATAIEDAQKQEHLPFGDHDSQSLSTVSSDWLEGFSPWSQCPNDEDTHDNHLSPTNCQSICTSGPDPYPYFFHSLLDASIAAAAHARIQPKDTLQSIDTNATDGPSSS
ncbi:hypothetical protein DM01DRAFT_1391216 [Hesseltinella vesiculosa]|uniref:STAS domain-containing protein n=1 Tax=Hesseltinella vesiculosa TaxID=101127 RepID=A0A1X2GFQ5_9FUNG|nr:hypothetical protein DM01DRAFT_1391216 [Hesseltinella vesiculosa]